MLIAPAKTSLEGCGVSLCSKCTSGRVYLYALGHYLAWIQIFDPQSALQMGSCDAEESWDSQSYSIFPSSGAHNRLCNWQKRPSIHQFFAAHSPPIRAKYFELWFVGRKDFIPLLHYPFFVPLGLMKPFDIVLLPQQRFLDNNPAT